MPTEREAYREHLIRHAPADAEARVEQARQVIRAEHALKAEVGGGPCICEWCREDSGGS